MFMAALGTLSYNGYTFDGSSKITCDIEFVQDEAQRTIIYQRQTFIVTATIADGGDTGFAMDQIKALLGEQGKTLVVSQRGFADALVVNGGGPVKDLKFGPVPRILQWEPVGANLACEIVWEVVVCIPYCDATAVAYRGVIAMNYGVSFAIKNGDTTRTISGYLEIAQTRNGRRAPDCADIYRRLVDLKPPVGFRRESNWDVTPDKSRLNFTVTDTQIASKFAFPAGVTNASGRHRAAWSRNNRGATRLRNSISMELEMAPGVSQAMAWSIFGSIVSTRIDWARRQQLPLLLDELTVEEDIWGRSTSFSVGYQILRSCAACLPQHAGLWQPINTDWTRWRVSMANVFDNRGTAQLGLLGGDAIIDLCGGQARSLTLEDRPRTPTEPYPAYRSIFRNATPDPRYSYIKYENAIVPARERPVQRQSYLQTPESPGELIGNDPVDRAQMSFGATGGTADVIQEGGRGRYDVAMVGAATRAGFPVPRPSIEQVGSQGATETAFKMASFVVGAWFGVPIYTAYWAGQYVLGGAPGQVRPEANPKEEVNANGQVNCNC
jgi:hypothetical protein